MYKARKRGGAKYLRNVIICIGVDNCYHSSSANPSSPSPALEYVQLLSLLLDPDKRRKAAQSLTQDDVYHQIFVAHLGICIQNIMKEFKIEERATSAGDFYSQIRCNFLEPAEGKGGYLYCQCQ